MNKSKEKTFAMIDMEELANLLAIDAWEHETRMQPEKELYEKTGETETYYYGAASEEHAVKQIKPVWASMFWGLRDKYRALIEQCQRPIE